MTHFFYTGFKVFEIRKTPCGQYTAELGNGKCVVGPEELVKAVLKAHEKLSRGTK